MTKPGKALFADVKDQPLFLGLMASGMVWLAVISCIMTIRLADPFHGYQLYDLQFLTILDGRLDLPPRSIGFEGWYAADGTAYMYHGVAPLLTRFALGWVWPFETISMAGVSIWFWAVLGTAGYQSALTGLARRAGIWHDRRNTILFLCVGLWLAGPGLLLVSNQSFYHEPVALAFGATGLFVAVWVRLVRDRITAARAAIVMGLLAALAFHARPNVAVALYAGTGLAICWGIWRLRAAFLLPALVSAALLGGGVLGYFALNDARLGTAAGVDGNHQRVYGFRFWGEEEANSERAEAFRNHGRFNALRVLPNLGLYIADVPVNWPGLFPASEVVYKTYRSVTEPILGFIRIEHPRIGMLIMWPVWLYLSVIGIWALRRDPKMAALAFCMALSFGLTLAYGTVTLRYRFDLWPFLGVLALCGAVSVFRPLVSRWNKRMVFTSLSAGFLLSCMASYEYSRTFRAVETDWTRIWSFEYCTELAKTAGFESKDDLARICRDPVIGGA